MATDPQGEVTKLLLEIEGGDEKAKHELYEVIYQELHATAQGMIPPECRNQTMQPTDLVSAAVLRLLDANVYGKGRRFFFGVVRRAMSQILWEYIEERKRKKLPVERNPTVGQAIVDQLRPDLIELLAQKEALQKLKETAPRQHEVFELHVFLGWKYPEIAAHLEVSQATVERDFRFARAFLLTQLADGETNES